MYSKENRTERGLRCESYVIDELVKRGYRLITRNYKIHNVGELDIVMAYEDDIYVIEVKARKVYKNYPKPIDAISNAKINKIKRTTNYLIREYKLYGNNIHFLASLVYLNSDGSVQKVEFAPF